MPYCNLACSWCDTSFGTYSRWTPEDFDAFVTKEPARFAVLTGGEPLMHKHSPMVVARLKALGFEIAVETNGTFPPIDGLDFITCSPKRDAGYEIDETLYPCVSEFKYVVDEGFDFSLLELHRDDPEHVRLSLSPEFGDFEKNVSKIIGYIEQYPRWRLSLQTHKWAGIP